MECTPPPPPLVEVNLNFFQNSWFEKGVPPPPDPSCGIKINNRPSGTLELF